MAALRARVRTRLEENTAAVWTDDELDECVAGALDACGWLFPAEVITTAAVLDGATSTSAPTGTQTVQRVVLADGTVVPRRRAPQRASTGEELAWELSAGTIHFTHELSAQTLTIWHSAAVTLDSLPESDKGLVALGAVVQALEVRAIQDFKRGGPLGGSSYDAVITRAREDFERAIARRSRRVRGGVVAG